MAKDARSRFHTNSLLPRKKHCLHNLNDRVLYNIAYDLTFKYAVEIIKCYLIETEI